MTPGGHPGTAVSAGDPTVDWDGVLRRSGRRQRLALPVVALWVWALATADPTFDWNSGWVRGYVVLIGVGLVVVLIANGLSPRVRQRDMDGRCAMYGIWHHVDPGSPSRTTADRSARYFAATRWLAWCFPFGGLALPISILDGDLSAVTLVAGAVLSLTGIAYGTWHWRCGTAARRWLADPPGPARAIPPPTRLERWVSPRRLLPLLVGLLVLGVGVGSLVALASG